MIEYPVSIDCSASRATVCLPDDMEERLRRLLDGPLLCVPVPRTEEKSACLRLFTEEKFAAWLGGLRHREGGALLARQIQASAYRLEKEENRLRVPLLLLTAAGIRGPAVLRLTEDGDAAICSASGEDA